MSAVPRAERAPVWFRGLSARTLGVLAVLGLVVAFSLSSTLVKRAETAGVLLAFWRLATVSLAWNVVLWSTGLVSLALREHTSYHGRGQVGQVDQAHHGGLGVAALERLETGTSFFGARAAA